MTLQYSTTKYTIYILFTVVCFAQKQSISTYILGNILAHVVYFAELVKTGLWAIWLQQHALYTWFLCTQARKVFFLSVKNHNKFRSQNNIPKYCTKRTWTSLLCLPNSTGTPWFADLPTALYFEMFQTLYQNFG